MNPIPPKRRSLKEYTDEDIIDCLENNTTIPMNELATIVAEVLRRMNERSPLFPEEKAEYHIPIDTTITLKLPYSMESDA